MTFIANHGYTKSSFEKKCGLPNATLGNAERRGNDLTGDVVETISNKIGDDLMAAGYHVMDMRPFGRQDLAILSSEEAEKIVSSLRGKISVEERQDEKHSENGTVTTGLLARALADQAQANKQQASGYRMQAEAYRELLELYKTMRKEMAQEKTLGQMTINLRDVAEDVTKLVDRQETAIKEFRGHFSILKAGKNPPSKGGRKRADRSNDDH